MVLTQRPGAHGPRLRSRWLSSSFPKDVIDPFPLVRGEALVEHSDADGGRKLLLMSVEGGFDERGKFVGGAAASPPGGGAEDERDG